MTPRRVLDRDVLVRAVLSSTAFVVLGFPALVIAAAYLPDVPGLARLGALLDVGIVLVLAAVLASTALAGLAVLLGGRRFTVLLLAAALVVLAGAGVVVYRYLAFAADNGVALDLLRTAEPAGEPPGPDAHVVYAEVEDQALGADIWRPAAAAGAAGPEGRAAVAYAHGGAFVAGNLGMRSALFDTLRKAGIVVIDIEYRLTPPPRWQDAPADVLCALVWLRSVAELEGIDPDRVVVMGESAGGSLALLAAYAAGTDKLTPSCPGEPIVPAGVAAVAPAADLEGIWQDKTLLVADRPFPEEYVGGPPSEFPERYDAASPFRLIRADLPPTLLLAGENDHLVRLPRVLRIAEALRAAGADVRLLVVPYAEHGFDGLPNGFGSQVELQIVPAFVAEVTG